MDRLTCVIAHPDSGTLDDLAALAANAGFTVKGACTDRHTLSHMLSRENPMILLLHAFFPGVDCTEIDSLLRPLHLLRIPGIVFLTPEKLPTAQASRLTPAVSMPFTANELICAAQTSLDMRMSTDLLSRAEALMIRMGIPDSPARAYLTYTTCILMNDYDAFQPHMQRTLPRIAAHFDLTPRAMANAMRRLIDKAWTTGDIETQYACFGNTIDASRGKPTLTAFLATAAEILRLEKDLK